MKNKRWFLLLAAALLQSCGGDNNQPKTSANRTLVTIPTATASTFPDVIPLDSANKMLSSYLNSIHYQNNDTDLQSIVFDAGLLRKYLDSIEGSPSITHLKVMFAHKLAYINSGNGNRFCGYNNKALTMIMVGYNASSNYVFFTGMSAVDNGMPCPNNCPPGNAGSPLFPTSTATNE